MRSFLSFFLTFHFLVVSVFTAPTSPTAGSNAKTLTVPNHGDFVGVRPGAYEEKGKDNKRVTIHPGVVVSGPSGPEGKYGVAMISKNLPHNPPQEAIHTFHQQSSIYGNVHLGPPKMVKVEHMKPWKDESTGKTQTPMDKHNLGQLRKTMAPHVNWKAPTPPPSPEPQSPHAPPGHGMGSRTPIATRPLQVNARPGGSRPPAIHQAAASNSESWRRPNTNTNAGSNGRPRRSPDRTTQKPTSSPPKGGSRLKGR